MQRNEYENKNGNKNEYENEIHVHCTWKWDADVEYIGRGKMALSSHMSGINFADSTNIRKAPNKLMTQVRTEAIHITNKYKFK